MPGIIDLHTNLHSPSKEAWEGYEFGTAAAVSGGVTTIVDLPTMKQPGFTSLKILK